MSQQTSESSPTLSTQSLKRYLIERIETLSLYGVERLARELSAIVADRRSQK